jgi:hypothetical protein
MLNVSVGVTTFGSLGIGKQKYKTNGVKIHKRNRWEQEITHLKSVLKIVKVSIFRPKAVSNG